MKNRFIVAVLFVSSMILTFETISYILLFGIIPSIVTKLGIFEYSMAITNYDFNKIWIGFICFSLLIFYNRIKQKGKGIYEIIFVCSYLFIGINIVLSSVVFSYFRLLGVPISDILSLQKYFGAIIFILYGLTFAIVPIVFLKGKPDESVLNDSMLEINNLKVLED